jgi:hypothetical protein
MSEFLHHIIDYRSVLLLFIFGVCLLGYGIPAWSGTGQTRYYGIYWLFVGILAIVGWCFFMFFGGN